MADTTARVLTLLGLLQARATWSGGELARRLGVTTRSVRRDVERLRDLGYPVRASRGVGGGYQLGAGRSLPPLVLDPEETVAVAVSLSLAAGGSVAGVEEAAVRAMAKLDQVLPTALRERVSAVQQATVTVPRFTRPVDPQTLLTLARASRDRVRVRFAHTPREQTTSTERYVEPYRLVSLGHRWYLLAFDLDRDDWRTFRLDRIGELAPTTFQFTPRAVPDAAAYVRDSVIRSPYLYVARVVLQAPADEVADEVPPTAGAVRPLDSDTCELEIGADTLPWIAMHVAAIDAPILSVDPPELAREMARLAQRLARASAKVSASASTS